MRELNCNHTPATASTTIAPAPWLLNGNGWVLLYHFPKSFVASRGFLDEYQRQSYQGWLGAVMMIDYKSSNVGPYQELLFIPGLFKMKGKWSFSISKIWVSSEASLQNGTRNWGIPKELANFNTTTLQNGSSNITVSKGERLFFEAQLKARGPALPFTSKLFPLMRLMQPCDHQLLLSKPKASGKLKLASMQKISADANFFPPLQELSPLACLSIATFQMNFPSAQPY